MDEVRRRSDGELCGLVDDHDESWLARTVFGAIIGRHETREGAIAQVLAEGLASLSDLWILTRAVDPTSEDCTDADGEQIVRIVEANRESVSLALGYYSMPGVPTMTIPASEILDGTWTLSLAI